MKNYIRAEKEVWSYFNKKYETIRKSKSSSFLMKLFAFALALVRVMPRKKFMTSFTTTVGTTIYTPGALDLRGAKDTPENRRRAIKSIIVCAHEHKHVQQYRRGRLKFIWRYLTNGVARALYEAEAYFINYELTILLHGVHCPVEYYLTVLKNYGCDEGAILCAETYLTKNILALHNSGKYSTLTQELSSLLKDST